MAQAHFPDRTVRLILFLHRYQYASSNHLSLVLSIGTVSIEDTASVYIAHNPSPASLLFYYIKRPFTTVILVLLCVPPLHEPNSAS